MAAAEPGSDAWEGYALLSHLRELGPGAIVSLEVRYAVRPERRYRLVNDTRRARVIELTLPDGETALANWVPLYDHGIGTTRGPAGGRGLIRQLELSKGGAGAFFDRLADELGYDELHQAHRFRVYLLGYRGDEGVWPRTE